MSLSSPFTDPKLMLIFTYAPAGLGHLRVTDALYHGLPQHLNPILLGAHDESVAGVHRPTSTHPLLRIVLERFQEGILENLFTAYYRWYLRTHTTLLYEQLTTVISQRIHLPRTVLIIATHFGLAHQVAALKKRIEHELGVRIKLIVQVTDDSPQDLWYVDGADLIIVPSHTTRKALLEYGRINYTYPVPISMAPYPLSPNLNKSLIPESFAQRKQQVSPELSKTTRIMLPISGAAVGVEYFTELVVNLRKQSRRFVFDVVVKESKFTQSFIQHLRQFSYVQLHVGTSDREVVELYEQVYEKEVIALEITKPSEQAFKALIRPNKVGGSILLFTHPVGRQEYDNLHFLQRHGLLPSVVEQQHLWLAAAQSSSLSREELYHATFWRGLRLPDMPRPAAFFINWCLENNLLTNLLSCRVFPRQNDPHSGELTPDGVEKFWELVGDV